MSIPFLLVTSKEKPINPLRLKVYQFRICEHKVKRPLYFSLHETFFPQTISDNNNEAQAAISNISPDFDEKSTSSTTKKVYRILPFVTWRRI